MTARQIAATDATTSASSEAEVCVRAVTKIYEGARGETLAVDDVTFDVRPQQFVALVGPSGSGKSTLLKMIAGLVPVSEGTIQIGDQVVTRPSREVGMMFQSPVLLPWRSVLANVLLPVSVVKRPNADQRARARQLLESVGLAEWADHYPHELSGGMQQRAAICRALIHDPPMLLLDEPFGALDSMTREVLNDLLAQICSTAGKTTVLVTHDIDEAIYLADRVIVMSARPGRLVADINIDLARPRALATRSLPAFEEHAAQIRLMLGLGDPAARGSVEHA